VVADAAYVGNAARHQPMTVDINSRPYGYAYLPSSLDPTNVSGGQAQPLPDDFLRPYQGWGASSSAEYTGYADYHSLQLSADSQAIVGWPVGGRRVHLPDLQQEPPGVRSIRAGQRARNYTSNGRRPHSLVVNYSYEVPNLSHVWNNLAAKAIFDDWQFSGVTTITSGTYGSLYLQLLQCAHGNAEWDRRDQHRRQPGDHHLQSESAAGRTYLRTAIQDRMRRSADRSVPSRARLITMNILGPAM
jgi:hypothetical protein